MEAPPAGGSGDGALHENGTAVWELGLGFANPTWGGAAMWRVQQKRCGAATTDRIAV